MLLLAFLYLMLTENRRALLLGQISAALAAVIALVVIITMFQLQSQIARFDAILGGGFGGPFSMISIGASIWVYLQLALSVFAVIFFIMRKHVFSGKPAAPSHPGGYA